MEANPERHTYRTLIKQLYHEQFIERPLEQGK